MTAETDIAAIDDGGANTVAEVRTALTSVLGRTWQDPALPNGTVGDIEWDGTDVAAMTEVTVSGSQTIIESNGLLSVSFTGQSLNDVNCLLSAQTIAIGDEWAVPVRTFTHAPAGGSGVALMAGVILTDGVTSGSNCVFVHLHTGKGDTAHSLVIGRQGTLTAASGATRVTEEILAHSFPWLWCKIIYNAANSWAIAASPDGLSYTTMGFATFAKTMTPTHVGIGWNNQISSGDAIATFGPLRKVA